MEQSTRAGALQRPLAIAHLYIVMNLQLDGKTALVTGSTAGIGLAIATALVNEGATVIVTAARRNELDAARPKQRRGPRNRGGSGHRGRSSYGDCALSLGRHPHKQSRHLRAEAVCTRVTMRLAPLLRSECDERSPVRAAIILGR